MTRRALRVIVREEAERDISEAAVWYERQQSGLGDAFLSEVESAIARAAANPFLFRCLRRKPEVRRVLTKRFPYRVFFVRRTDAVVVFRVLHGARHERKWKENIPNA